MNLSISLLSFFFFMHKMIPFRSLYFCAAIRRSLVQHPDRCLTSPGHCSQFEYHVSKQEHNASSAIDLNLYPFIFFSISYCTFWIHVFKLHLVYWMRQKWNLYQHEETYVHCHLVKDEMPVIQLPKNTWLERRCSLYKHTLCLIICILLSGDW